jgi:hypothetical protein
MDISTGTWSRFERYEMRDGYLRPAPGAELVTYDPWESYLTARELGSDPPYQTLVALVTQQRTGRRFVERELLRWVQEYGLLGVLLHRAQIVTLHPIWQPSPRRAVVRDPGGLGSAVAKLPGDAGRLRPRRVLFTRSNVGWWPAHDNSYAEESGELEGEPEQLGRPVPPAEIPAEWRGASGVLLRDLDGFGTVWEPLEGTWALYFPDVADHERGTHQYPLPASEDFWRAYAEPIDEFWRAARLLDDALGSLADQSAAGPADDLTRRLAINWGWVRFNSLLAPVGPGLVVEPGAKYRQRWFAPSLLGSFAMMALQDLSDPQRRPRRCEACGCVFLTTRTTARFCSDRCRFRAHKRATRAAAIADSEGEN